MPYIILGGVILLACVVVFFRWRDSIRQAEVRKLEDQRLQEKHQEESVSDIREYELTEKDFEKINEDRMKRGFQKLSWKIMQFAIDGRRYEPYENLLAATLSKDPNRIETMYEFLVNYAEQVDNSGASDIINVINSDIRKHS